LGEHGRASSLLYRLAGGRVEEAASLKLWFLGEKNRGKEMWFLLGYFSFS